MVRGFHSCAIIVSDIIYIILVLVMLFVFW